MERKPLQVLGILQKSLISLSVAINILSMNTVYVMVISVKSGWQFDTLIPVFSPTLRFRCISPERWRTMARLYKNEILFSRLFFPYIFRKEFRNTCYKYIHKIFSNISGGHSRLPL